MRYVPRPIDTAATALPSALDALVERLAENAHELWAEERLAQGWSHGSQRDDARRTHPSLVPYTQLPESEKTFDRRTVVGTLKALLALGYRIEKA